MNNGNITDCQGRSSGGQRCRIIDRKYTLEWSNVRRREVLLGDNRKKTPADR